MSLPSVWYQTGLTLIDGGEIEANLKLAVDLSRARNAQYNNVLTFLAHCGTMGPASSDCSSTFSYISLPRLTSGCISHSAQVHRFLNQHRS